MYEPDAMPQRCKLNPSFHLAVNFDFDFDFDFDSAKYARRKSAMHILPREMAMQVLNAPATEVSVS
jgi:hypothetical protein